MVLGFLRVYALQNIYGVRVMRSIQGVGIFFFFFFYKRCDVDEPRGKAPEVGAKQKWLKINLSFK